MLAKAFLFNNPKADTEAPETRAVARKERRSIIFLQYLSFKKIVLIDIDSDRLSLPYPRAISC
jgi:hypothetical protein